MKFSTTPSLHHAARGAGAGVDPRLLEQLFDHTPDLAFFIKDDRGRYVAVNHSLVERHGLKAKLEMIGKRPSDVCPGDFGRIPAEQDAYVLRTGRAIMERLELQWYSPHKPVWCLTTKLPIISPAGVVTGIIGISQDVRSPIRPREIPADLAKALHRLETGYAEPLTPSELAGVAGLPVARFARLVKRIFGITPIQLITKTRIAAASRMLRETDHSVARIAQECGYYDHSAFTRSFRAVTSVTPTQFRAEGPQDRKRSVRG
jgi:PAS domain S-box-containing protein